MFGQDPAPQADPYHRFLPGLALGVVAGVGLSIASETFWPSTGLREAGALLAVGSFLAYGLCRLLGRRAQQRHLSARRAQQRQNTEEPGSEER